MILFSILLETQIPDMTDNVGQINADESAAGIIKCIHELNIENSGTFLHINGTILP